MNIRPAYSTDAAVLADLINQSSEGMCACMWQHLAEGDESPLGAGARLVHKETGVFSFRHATVVAKVHEVFGMISGRHLLASESPAVLDEYLPFVRALIKLEQHALDTWNIVALAVFEEHRRHGLATQLLEAAEQLAQTLNIRQMSIIVASENPSAIELVEDYGFRCVATEPVVRCGVMTHNGDWLLMVKDI